MDHSIVPAAAATGAGALPGVALPRAQRGAPDTPTAAARRSEAAARRERPEAPKLDRAELEQVVKDLNLRVPEERGIRFEVSGEGAEVIVQVVDQTSDEVVRTIPQDRLSHLRRHFDELTGTIIDDLA